MYKHNTRNGAVICNKCSVIIEANISYEEYAIEYADRADLCGECAEINAENKTDAECQPRVDERRRG